MTAQTEAELARQAALEIFMQGIRPGEPVDSFVRRVSEPAIAAALAAKDAKIERPKERVAVPAQYRHYKGDIYELLAVAEREGDCEPMAVYRHAVTKRMWTRPMVEFREKFTALSHTDKPEDGG